MECADTAGACSGGLFGWPQVARCDIPDCSQLARNPEQQLERIRCERGSHAALLECAEKKMGQSWVLTKSLLEYCQNRAPGMIRGLTKI